jgi:hypothetical protein
MSEPIAVFKTDQVDNRLKKQEALFRVEIEELLKLIIVMAIDGYGYRPTSFVPSNIPQEIKSDMRKLGMFISIDDVRKYLKEGSKLLPTSALHRIKELEKAKLKEKY